MDFQRLLLFAALSLTLLMMWQAWQEDYGPKPPAPAATAQAPAASEMPAAPQLGNRNASDAPSLTAQPALSSAQRVRVTTDLFEVEIDATGADLRRADLVKYPVSVEEPDNPFRLFDDSAEKVLIAQSALIPAAGTQSPAPNHHALFSAARDEYVLPEGEETLRVPLTWTDASGLKVTKVYTFRRGSYVIDVDFEIDNASGTPWRGHMYRQLQRSKPEDKTTFIYTYTGGVLYTEEEKYEKIDFDDMESANLKREAVGGWAAMIQHYFLGAWIPAQDEKNSYYTKAPGNQRYIIGSLGEEAQVAPGEKGRLQAQLYIGPKLQKQLEQVAPGLELTVDYGVLTIIAKPLFWLLDVIHSFVGNWGWAIILLTILIKLAFYKLSETSYKSMAHMRKVQPRLQSIKEQYGNDRQKLNEAMMRLYKEEKINPLGGCLPILVQIPVFIALYWTLLESVEMRQAPFMLWINDLSTADPYFVLPILMGASMLIQHRLNPTPMDPIQARVMMVLPIVFTFFFLWFPAGLVLYWVVNNILSITQQWYITRMVVKA